MVLLIAIEYPQELKEVEYLTIPSETYIIANANEPVLAFEGSRTANIYFAEVQDELVGSNVADAIYL